MAERTQPKSGSRFRAVAVKRRDRTVAIVLLMGIIAGLIALRVSHPSGWIPQCPTNAFLGFLCPGCGSMRATHHLMRLEIGHAFDHNPLLIVLGVPLAIGFVLELVMIAVRGKRVAFIPRSAVLAWIALVVLIVFTVVRNLPGGVGEFLSPPTHEHHSRSISTPPGIDLRNDLPYPVFTTRGSRTTT
jgi:hypothetical protein